ncbi:hypothetical protein DDM78_18845, partial [Vibrio cholerae]|nr:hypothetical protein [Vibrio cholerae]
TQAKYNAIAHKLNNRPRARLGFKTPEECLLDIIADRCTSNLILSYFHLTLLVHSIERKSG